MTHRPSTHGFTIVELLVVAAIMATLLGLILAGGRSGTGSEVRRAARQIAAVLLSTQSRAIGSRIGAAVLLESDGDPAALAPNASPRDPKNDRAVRVRDAEMAPAITAEVISPYQVPPWPDTPTKGEGAYQPVPFHPDRWVVPIPTEVDINSGNPKPPPIFPENASSSELDSGFRIRFTRPGTPWSAWYGFLPRGEDQNGNGALDQGEDMQFAPSVPPNGKLDSVPAVSFRFKAGQTSENSVWPSSIPVQDGSGVPPPRYRVEISRYPGAGSLPSTSPSWLRSTCVTAAMAMTLRRRPPGDDSLRRA